MPETAIYYFKDDDGSVPFLEWLKETRSKNENAATKCLYGLNLLKLFGYELRRPHADFLSNGIYELRISYRHQQYRILYFFIKEMPSFFLMD